MAVATFPATMMRAFPDEGPHSFDPFDAREIAMENVRAAVDTARRAVSRRDARRRLPMKTIILASALGVFLALYPNAAPAQNGRSYVSRLGSDANNCQLATPCRGFLTALANTTNGGIINCLD